MHVGIGKCARIFPARKRRSTRRCVFVFRAFFASVPGGRNMSHTIAGIDVHKKLLVVVIADEAKPDVPLQSRRFGTGSAELHHLSAWLSQYGVVEAVMESTAQYWKPVWMELEPHLRLHLAQAQSNKARPTAASPIWPTPNAWCGDL